MASKKGKEKPIKPEEEKDIAVPDTSKEIAVIQKVIEKNPDDVFKNLTNPQLKLIKDTIAKGATDEELKFFLNVCASAKLNPFLRQAHFVKRWDNRLGREIGQTQIGIDGFRAIAEEGGQYAGSDDAIFKDDVEIVSEKSGKIMVPSIATVTVYKLLGGVRCPFTASIRWEEYYPGEKQGFMWRKMPYGQMAKCAESLALRKAFPKLLSGLYSDIEMDRANSEVQEKPSLFDTAKKSIASAKDSKGLVDFTEKLAKSDKYTKEEKEQLIAIISEQITKLDHANAVPVLDAPINA